MVEIISVLQDIETGALVERGTAVPNWTVISYLVLKLLIPIAFYVLRSIGLFTLAKRAGIQKRILAIFPFLWVFVACKIIGNQRLFGKTFEKFALLACILFSVIGVVTLAYDIICYFPIIGNVLEGRTIYISNSALSESQYVQTLARSEFGYIYGDTSFVDPYGNAMYLICIILHYLTMITSVVSVIITVLIYFNLFRKYWPQHYILAMVLSILGLFGVFVFVIRKREPVDYATYMKEKYKNMYGGYAGPYGYHNPYQNNYNQPRQTPPNPNSPFEDFEDKKKDPGDPFDEFK